MRMRSGWNCSSTSRSALPKSPTKEQQMQPEDISEISTPESFKKPPSMLISPNSFSMSTSFSPWNASARSFLMSVVFPAPKKPEIMSIFVMVSSPLLIIFNVLILSSNPENATESQKIHSFFLRRTAGSKASISRTAVADSASRHKRFGTAIRALQISDRANTVSRRLTAPTPAARAKAPR